MQGPFRDRLEDLLATLRAEEVEPAPGFYARVLQRIEERESESLWSFFVDSPFSKRLALASLTITLALGSYVVSAERHEASTMSQNIVAFSGTHYDAPVMGSQAEQRDAVLENFAEHYPAGNQGQIR